MTGRITSHDKIELVDDVENNFLSNEICDHELDFIMNRENLFRSVSSDLFGVQIDSNFGINLEGEMYDVVVSSSGNQTSLNRLY